MGNPLISKVVAAWIVCRSLCSVSCHISVHPSGDWPPDVPVGNAQNDVNLICVVDSDVTPFNVTWYKDGKLLVSDDHFRITAIDADSFELSISNPQLEDSGNYMCLGVNQVKERANYTSYLDVYKTDANVAPTILRIHHPDVVSFGDDVNLTCVIRIVDAIGFAAIWSRHDQPLPDNSKFIWNPSFLQSRNEMQLGLTINSITEADLGNYTCRANNSMGLDRKTYTLKLTVADSKIDVTMVSGIAGGGVGLLFMVVLVVFLKLRRKKKEVDVEDLPWMDPKNYDQLTQPLEYDVFISYSSHDQPWVKDILMKNLENEGYRVCIDFKSFLPGDDVVENIMEAIYKSKRTIVVMSNHFLKSVWAQFELKHVHHRLITMRDDCLLLIKYDNCRIPGKLLGKTFLDWNDNSVKPHFWQRLYDALGKERVKFDESIPPILCLGIPSAVHRQNDHTEAERQRRECPPENGPIEKRPLLRGLSSESFGSFDDNVSINGVGIV